MAAVLAISRFLGGKLIQSKYQPYYLKIAVLQEIPDFGWQKPPCEEWF
jgi:hypothetical protein